VVPIYIILYLASHHFVLFYLLISVILAWFSHNFRW